MGAKVKKSSWVVTMIRTIKSEVICDNCTEEQAREKPFDFSVSERELDGIDWDVESVEENV